MASQDTEGGRWPAAGDATTRSWLRTHCVLCWQELSGATLARVTDDGAGVLAAHASHGGEARRRGFTIPVAAFPLSRGLPSWVTR